MVTLRLYCVGVFLGHQPPTKGSIICGPDQQNHGWGHLYRFIDIGQCIATCQGSIVHGAGIGVWL